MTFLNPAVLFGLLAASIPIVLHFLNLRKLKRVEFSTLAFLKELQKTKIKRIKLKQWILLLLRIVIILLLVSAFARPTIKSVSIGNSSTAKTTAVIIIDNTFSMAIVSEKGSYFNRAKQVAKNLFNSLQDGDEVAIVPIGELQKDAPRPTTNFKQAVQSIDDLPVSNISGTLNEATVKGAEVLSLSKNFNKEIYILTDLQKGRIYNSENELSNLSQTLGQDVRIYLIDLSSKDAVNLGIDDLTSTNQIFQKGKTVGFTAKVKNYSKQAVNNSVVSLFINGKRSAQQSLNLASNETKDIPFEVTLADTGLVDVYAELEEDDILNDNKRFFSVHVPDKISLLVLSDNRDDSKFVKLALENPAQEKIKITETGFSQTSSINFKNYDAVFIIGSEKNPDWKNLSSFIEQGGKVVLMPGSQSTIQNFQKLCSEINISAPSNIVGKINSQESIAQFDKTDFQNPIFIDLFENKTPLQIESPEIYYYFKINPADKGKNIIGMIDGSSFLSEYKIGKGKVFLFNSPPLLSCNNFPMKGFYAPLMNKLTLICASKMKERETVVAGQNITVDISNHTVPQIKIIKPSGALEFINTDSLSNKNYLSYNHADETGTYKYFSGGNFLDYASINHDPRESVTERLDASDFKDYLKRISFDGKVFEIPSGDDFTNVIYQSRFGTELWKYFLVAAFILAMIESLVARNSKKELSRI
jgi:hypothetical protein